MNCKYCGENILDDANYCNHCGKELDEYQRCPVCHEAIKVQNSVYCANCGFRLDGKNKCSCGFVYEGNFCPMCGKAATNKSPKTKTAKPQSFLRPWQKALSLASLGTGLFTAALALLFVFFLGLSVEADGDLKSLNVALDLNERYSIFYFFGDAYKDLYASLESLTIYSSGYEVVSLLICIFATIAAAVSIILTVVFFIVATVKSIYYFIDNSRPSPLKYCLLTAFSYFTGTIAFLFTTYNSLEIEQRINDLEIEAVLGANQATKAGIIVCAILAAIALALKFAAKYDVLFKKERLVPTILSACKLALVVIACAVIGKGITETTVSVDGFSDKTTNVSTANVFYFVYKLFEGNRLFPNEYLQLQEDAFILPLILGAIAIVLTLLVIFFSAFSILKNLDTLDENCKKSILWQDILLTALVISALVVTVISTSLIKDLWMEIYTNYGVKESTTLTYGVGSIIGGLCLIVVTLGCSIAQKIVTYCQSKN